MLDSKQGRQQAGYARATVDYLYWPMSPAHASVSTAWLDVVYETWLEVV